MNWPISIMMSRKAITIVDRIRILIGDVNEFSGWISSNRKSQLWGVGSDCSYLITLDRWSFPFPLFRRWLILWKEITKTSPSFCTDYCSIYQNVSFQDFWFLPSFQSEWSDSKNLVWFFLWEFSNEGSQEYSYYLMIIHRNAWCTCRSTVKSLDVIDLIILDGVKIYTKTERLFSRRNWSRIRTFW